MSEKVIVRGPGEGRTLLVGGGDYVTYKASTADTDGGISASRCGPRLGSDRRCTRTLTASCSTCSRAQSIVKLTVYLTDMNKLRDYTRMKARFIEGEQPASTAIGVASLALPGMMIEIEATAVL